MIKPMHIDRAQELMRQLTEVSWRLGILAKRDKSWDQGLRIEVGLEPIFGNDESWTNSTELDYSAGFHEAATKIVDVIKAYLECELVRIRSELEHLGVEFEDQGAE